LSHAISAPYSAVGHLPRLPSFPLSRTAVRDNRGDHDKMLVFDALASVCAATTNGPSPASRACPRPDRGGGLGWGCPSLRQRRSPSRGCCPLTARQANTQVTLISFPTATIYTSIAKAIFSPGVFWLRRG
jgi:hypothetical protein